MGRRLLGMAAQFMDLLAALDVPHPADHIIRNARHQLPIRTCYYLANPLRMCIDVAYLLLLCDIPPDQLAVVTTAHEHAASEGNACNIAFMGVEILGLDFLGGEIDLAHLEVRGADESPRRLRYPGDCEDDRLVAVFFDELQLIRISGCHGGVRGKKVKGEECMMCCSLLESLREDRCGC